MKQRTITLFFLCVSSTTLLAQNTSSSTTPSFFQRLFGFGRSVGTKKTVDYGVSQVFRSAGSVASKTGGAVTSLLWPTYVANAPGVDEKTYKYTSDYWFDTNKSKSPANNTSAQPSRWTWSQTPSYQYRPPQNQPSSYQYRPPQNQPSNYQYRPPQNQPSSYQDRPPQNQKSTRKQYDRQ